MEVNPLCVILVKSDSKGDRLLFRYPYKNSVETYNDTLKEIKRRNPYSMNSVEDVLQTSQQQTSNIYNGQLSGFTDEVLSTLFAVKQELCNQKFELKVNDVRFVGHPTLMQAKDNTTNKEYQQKSSDILINIVFALYAQASYSIVKCYYELSKKLGYALVYEEDRLGYLSNELNLMVKTHDEVAALIEQEKNVNNSTVNNDLSFDLVLDRSSLAQCLKSIYHDLCTTGLLNTTINQSVTLCFCLPQKAHQFHKKGVVVEPETIDKCLKSLKPYHGMLLLVDFSELLDCVPPSAAPLLLQLCEVYNPLKSLQNMASEADLLIDHVYQLVGHLVYWAKATIIYPLCETNVYVIAPDAPLHTNSPLVEKFSSRFPGTSLFEVISDFSLPTSIGHLTTPLQQPTRQGTLAQMVLWMLQHHLLMQLHTYVQFMPNDSGKCDEISNEYELGESLDVATTINYDVTNHETNVMSIDEEYVNTGSLLSMSSQPMPVPHTSHRSITEDHYSRTDSTSVSDNINVQPSSSHKSNYSMTQSASLSTENCDSIASIEDEEKIKELLNVFQEPDRSAVKQIPAALNVDDLSLMVKLWQAGYFKGEHHLEEIMYFENLRRSQLLQLLDKFRDVLIIYETEDPAIASLYNSQS